MFSSDQIQIPSPKRNTLYRFPLQRCLVKNGNKQKSINKEYGKYIFYYIVFEDIFWQYVVLPVKNHIMVKPTMFDIVAVKIPHPNNNWAIKTIADFLPQRSEMRPAPNVPTANPAKNNILATTEINIKYVVVITNSDTVKYIV